MSSRFFLLTVSSFLFQVLIYFFTASLACCLAVVNQKIDSKSTNRREVPEKTDEYGASTLNSIDHPPLKSDDIEARISNFEATTPVFPLTAPHDDYGEAGLSPPDPDPILANGYSYVPPVNPSSVYGAPALPQPTYNPSSFLYNPSKASYLPPLESLKPYYYPPPKATYFPLKPIYGPPTLPSRPIYGPPSPKPVYSPLKPIYGLPKPVYGPPNHDYRPPKPEYGLPKPEYGAPLPRPVYGAPSLPKPEYRPPRPEYGVPEFSIPKPIHWPSKPEYNPPKPEYGPPPQPEYGPPPKPQYVPSSKPEYRPPLSKPEYGPPKPESEPPKPEYGHSRPEYGPPRPDYGLPSQPLPKPPHNPTNSYLPPPPKTNYGAPLKAEGLFPSQLLFHNFKSSLFGGNFHTTGVQAPPTPPVISYDGWHPMKVPESKDIHLNQELSQISIHDAHTDHIAQNPEQPVLVSSQFYEGLAPPSTQPIGPNYDFMKPLSSFDHSLTSHSGGATVIGFPSGSYGVPNCDHSVVQFSSNGCCATSPDLHSNNIPQYGLAYGVPSGKQIDGPNLRPKTPIKFRPPVPPGLLDSSGPYGPSQSTFSGQRYIPPAVPEVSKSSNSDSYSFENSDTKNSQSFDVPPKPSHLLESPHNPQISLYNQQSPNLQTSINDKHRSIYMASSGPTASDFSQTDYSSKSISHTIPSSSSNEIFQQAGSIVNDAENSDGSSKSSNSYDSTPNQFFNVPLPTGSFNEQSSYLNNYQGLSANNPEFQSIFKSLGDDEHAISQSQSIEIPSHSQIHEYPVQGNHGQYTLQIQSADSSSNGLSGISHDQVLSNGLLQDILSAIEHQNSGSSSQSNTFYDKSESLLTAGSNNVLHEHKNFHSSEDRTQRHLQESTKGIKEAKVFSYYTHEGDAMNVTSANDTIYDFKLLNDSNNDTSIRYIAEQLNSTNHGFVSAVENLLNFHTPNIGHNVNSTVAAPKS